MAQQGDFVRVPVEPGGALAGALDASSRHVPPLRYPFIPARAALSVRGLSSGRPSPSPLPPPDRSRERLICVVRKQLRMRDPIRTLPS